MPSLKYKYLFPVRKRSSMKALNIVFMLPLFCEITLLDKNTSSSSYCLLSQYCAVLEAWSLPDPPHSSSIKCLLL